MDERNSRFQLVIPASLLEEVRKLATSERRSVSNMIVVLVMEAVRARKKRAEERGDSLPAMLETQTRLAA